MLSAELQLGQLQGERLDAASPHLFGQHPLILNHQRYVLQH